MTYPDIIIILAIRTNVPFHMYKEQKSIYKV